MIHLLKTVNPHYTDLRKGKGCEVRKNDRDFKVNDIVILAEYDSKEKKFSGDWIAKNVTHVCDYNQKKGYVVLSIEEIPYQSFFKKFSMAVINSSLKNQKGFTI